eukprot:14453603-Alexandrium_andersonii.AAC.1
MQLWPEACRPGSFRPWARPGPTSPDSHPVPCPGARQGASPRPACSPCPPGAGTWPGWPVP